MLDVWSRFFLIVVKDYVADVESVAARPVHDVLDVGFGTGSDEYAEAGRKTLGTHRKKLQQRLAVR